MIIIALALYIYVISLEREINERAHRISINECSNIHYLYNIILAYMHADIYQEDIMLTHIHKNIFFIHILLSYCSEKQGLLLELF